MAAREKISRFVEANKSSDHPPFNPETGHAVDDPEAHLTALLDEHAREVVDRARRGVDVMEESLGAHQCAKDVREILDMVDPTVPDPDGWEF